MMLLYVFIGFAVGMTAGALIARLFWPKIVTTERTIVNDLTNIDAVIKSEASRLVEHVEKNFAGMEGEFKRSQVYRALLNIFPNASKSDLGLAIEMAVRK